MNWSSITHIYMTGQLIWRSRTFQGYDVHIKTTAGRTDRASWNIISEGSAHRVSASYPELYKHKWSTMYIDIPLLPSQIRDRVESPESMSWFSPERMKKARLSVIDNVYLEFSTWCMRMRGIVKRLTQHLDTPMGLMLYGVLRPQPAFP